MREEIASMPLTESRSVSGPSQITDCHLHIGRKLTSSRLVSDENSNGVPLADGLRDHQIADATRSSYGQYVQTSCALAAPFLSAGGINSSTTRSPFRVRG